MRSGGCMNQFTAGVFHHLLLQNSFAPVIDSLRLAPAQHPHLCPRQDNPMSIPPNSEPHTDNAVSPFAMSSELLSRNALSLNPKVLLPSFCSFSFSALPNPCLTPPHGPGGFFVWVKLPEGVKAEALLAACTSAELPADKVVRFATVMKGIPLTPQSRYGMALSYCKRSRGCNGGVGSLSCVREFLLENRL